MPGSSFKGQAFSRPEQLPVAYFLLLSGYFFSRHFLAGIEGKDGSIPVALHVEVLPLLQVIKQPIGSFIEPVGLHLYTIAQTKYGIDPVFAAPEAVVEFAFFKYEVLHQEDAVAFMKLYVFVVDSGILRPSGTNKGCYRKQH
jgi:hypothetical protein